MIKALDGILGNETSKPAPAVPLRTSVEIAKANNFNLNWLPKSHYAEVPLIGSTPKAENAKPILGHNGLPANRIINENPMPILGPNGLPANRDAAMNAPKAANSANNTLAAFLAWNKLVKQASASMGQWFTVASRQKESNKKIATALAYSKKGIRHIRPAWELVIQTYFMLEQHEVALASQALEHAAMQGLNLLFSRKITEARFDAAMSHKILSPWAPGSSVVDSAEVVSDNSMLSYSDTVTLAFLISEGSKKFKGAHLAALYVIENLAARLNWPMYASEWEGFKLNEQDGAFDQQDSIDSAKQFYNDLVPIFKQLSKQEMGEILIKALPVQTGNYPQIALPIVLSVLRAYGAANGLSLKAERLEDIQALTGKAAVPQTASVQKGAPIMEETAAPAEVASPAKEMAARGTENEVGVPETVTAPVMATAPPQRLINVVAPSRNVENFLLQSANHPDFERLAKGFGSVPGKAVRDAAMAIGDQLIPILVKAANAAEIVRPALAVASPSNVGSSVAAESKVIAKVDKSMIAGKDADDIAQVNWRADNLEKWYKKGANAEDQEKDDAVQFTHFILLGRSFDLTGNTDESIRLVLGIAEGEFVNVDKDDTNNGGARIIEALKSDAIQQAKERLRPNVVDILKNIQFPNPIDANGKEITAQQAVDKEVARRMGIIKSILVIMYGQQETENIIKEASSKAPVEQTQGAQPAAQEAVPQAIQPPENGIGVPPWPTAYDDTFACCVG